MTAPYTGYSGYEARYGYDSPIAHHEWQQFQARQKELLDAILNAGAQFGNTLTQQQAPQNFTPPAHPVENAMTQVRPAGEEELIGQARFWGIPDPEHMSAQDLMREIQLRRSMQPRDEQTDLGSASLAILGAASEAGGAASRVIGNLLGDVHEIPFIGETLSRVLGTDKAKRFMYDLSMTTAEFTEAARAAQPLQDKGAFEVMTGTGKIAGYALPVMAVWNAIGALGGYVPEAWAGRVTSPLARSALQGALTGVATEIGSDEPTSAKAFNIGLGSVFGLTTALPKIGASLGFGLVGYGIGAQVGDTPEERRRHGIEGAIAFATLPLLPVFLGAAGKLRQDIPTPHDIAVENAVKRLPAGRDFETGQPGEGVPARLMAAQEPEPQLVVRSDPISDTPVIEEAPQVQAPTRRAYGGKLDGTKVVGEDGQPLTVYHGTLFDYDLMATGQQSRLGDGGIFGPGFYHTDNPEIASRYAELDVSTDMRLSGMINPPTLYPQVRPAKLNIQNPFDMERRMNLSEALEFIDRIESVKPDYDWNPIRQRMHQELSGLGRASGQIKAQDLYDVMGEALPKTSEPSYYDTAKQYRNDGIRATGMNDALQQLGYDGAVGIEHAPDISYRVWAAFSPEQVHSPWDVEPLSHADAAATGDGITKQSIVMESPTLPQAVGQAKVTDTDVIKAAQATNPAGATVIRGVTDPLNNLDPSITYIPRGRNFDAIVGGTPQQVSEFEQYGVFTGQKVVTASGLEGEVSRIGDLITIKREGSPPLRVRPEKVLPSRVGNKPPGEILYHGTSAPDFSVFHDKPVYLTSDPAEAKVYATNDILGGGRGVGTRRVLEVRVKQAGRTRDIDQQVQNEIMGDGYLDELIDREVAQAKAEGVDFLTFQHPGMRDYFTVKVAVNPAKSLEIVKPGPLDASDLWDSFKSDVLMYANQEATKAGMAPVEDLFDPRVTSMLDDRATSFLESQGVTDPATRQVVKEDFSRRFAQEARDLDPEARDFQAAAVEDAVAAHNASEESDLHNIPVSIEEKAEKRGFIWVSRPGEGGSFKDTINPGTPDIPVATDAAALEFLARVDRAVPDYTPVSDVPVDAAIHLPNELGDREPRLSTEDLADLYYRTNEGMSREDFIERLNTTEGQNELARRLLADELETRDFRRQYLGEGGAGLPPVPPTGGGGSAGAGGQGALPPGHPDSLGAQFDRMRRAEPEKLHSAEQEFQGLLSSKFRYTRYGMLGLEDRLANLGIDLGTAWKHYEELSTAKTLAFNEATPWLNEAGKILREFPRRILRDGTVTRIHEIEDPNARAAAWWRLGESHGLSDAQIRKAIKADDAFTNWWHRIFMDQTGDPASAMSLEREIFRYMPRVRARQAQGVKNPYDQEFLSPELEFFAEHSRENGVQFRIVDPRELVTRYVNSLMFKRHAEVPWNNLVSAWQDPRVPDTFKDYVLDYAKLVRYGYDPKGEIAVRAVQSIMKHVAGTPVTVREAAHMLNVPSSAMYMSMLGGRTSIFFRDAIQPLLALAKVRMGFMRGTYADVMAGAGRAITTKEVNQLRAMYQRGLDGGWIERENPNLEAASFFEEQPGLRENELLHLTPEQAARRENAARVGDVAYGLPAWLVRPQQSNLSTLKWYGRQGQLHRLLVGESAYRQAMTTLGEYRTSYLDAVNSGDPARAMSYDQMANKAFFSSFERPIQNRLRQLVESGDDDAASQLFAREVANWSQFRYGRREMPPAIRSNIGRMLTMFGSFTGQLMEATASATTNGTVGQRARFWMVLGGVSAAMYEAKHLTGWGFDKWAWVPQAYQFAGSPFAERVARLATAATGTINLMQGRQPSDFEGAAIQEEAQALRSPMAPFYDFFPYAGYIRSAGEYSSALQGINPVEQIARYSVTGDRGSRIDIQRMIEDMARRQGNVPVGTLSPNGGLMPGRTSEIGGYRVPQGYRIPSPPGSGAMP